MATRSPLLVAAALTAGLGIAALATGSGAIAAASGLAAIAVASLTLRATSGLGEPDAGGLTATGGDDDGLGGEDAVDELDVYRAGITRSAAGMLDEDSLRPALRSRTAVARRALRPLSVVHLDVLDIGEDGRTHGGCDLDEGLLDATLREADLCGRRRDGVYVLVLQDTGEDGAVWTAERLRRRLTADGGLRRYCAGVASYPAHALDAETLDAKAAEALEAAREWRQDRIEVATGS